MSDIDEIVARNVRQLRGKTSQGKIAEDAGLSLNGIQKIEAAERSAKVSTIESIAKALGVKPFQLLMEDPTSLSPAAPPTAEEIDATVARQAREITELKAEIASLKSDPAYELQRKLVQLKQEFGAIMIEKDAKIKELRAQLVVKKNENREIIPPELSRVLNYPEILERVLSLIRGWEEQEGLTPSAKKPAQE